jgi:hypothetical protein
MPPSPPPQTCINQWIFLSVYTIKFNARSWLLKSHVSPSCSRYFALHALLFVIWCFAVCQTLWILFLWKLYLWPLISPKLSVELDKNVYALVSAYMRAIWKVLSLTECHLLLIRSLFFVVFMYVWCYYTACRDFLRRFFSRSNIWERAQNDRITYPLQTECTAEKVMEYLLYWKDHEGYDISTVKLTWCSFYWTD